MSPEDVHSPTVSTECLKLLLAIDAHQGRYVVTADVVGAYLHAMMDDFVIMIFEGEIVEYLVQQIQNSILMNKVHLSLLLKKAVLRGKMMLNMRRIRFMESLLRICRQVL